jgi:uncharacterized membrane protein YheB (UPF0754 family)
VDLNSIIDDFQRNYLLYLSMPLMAAFIGYVTKLVAIRMMFEPLEPIGIFPLQWQGIVPRRAERMATIACDTMTARLISPEEIFSRLDPERVALELNKPLMESVEIITTEVMERHKPGLWLSLPNAVRDALIRRMQTEAPAVIAEIMEDVRANIDKVFDLKHMVISNLVRDKNQLNKIFQEVGHAEFKFIAHSGIYFGFLIGVVQMVAWMLTHNPWVMPIFGLFTGWFTDWLALKMIFHPMEPKKYFGFITWQGLFLKRRKEVAADYGALIAQEILTPANITRAVLEGPLSDKLFALVERHVMKTLDSHAGMAKPLLLMTVGTENYIQIKQESVKKVIEHMPYALKSVEKYAEDAMDIRNTMVTKMQQLTPHEFERLLRPAFQQDEWILITVGAVLGFLVGELQVQLILPMVKY